MPTREPAGGAGRGLARAELRGNVRELASAVERALLAADPSDLAARSARAATGAGWGFDPAVPFRIAKERATGRWERHYLRS